MDNAIFSFPKPINEPVKAYAPGSSEKSTFFGRMGYPVGDRR